MEHRLEMDRKRTGRPSDIPSMNPKQLREEYATMRKELQKFDETFNSYYGRKPLTTDKEYLRPLYARYKNVKVHLEPHVKSGNDSHRKLNPHDRQSPRPLAPIDGIVELKKLEENKKKEEELKKKEDELKRKEDEQKKKEEELKRKEDEQKKKEEDLKRKEEEQKKKEEDQKRGDKKSEEKKKKQEEIENTILAWYGTDKKQMKDIMKKISENKILSTKRFSTKRFSK